MTRMAHYENCGICHQVYCEHRNIKNHATLKFGAENLISALELATSAHTELQLKYERLYSVAKELAEVLRHSLGFDDWPAAMEAVEAFDSEPQLSKEQL